MSVENASMLLAGFAIFVTIFWFLIIAVFHSSPSDYYFASAETRRITYGLWAKACYNGTQRGLEFHTETKYT